MNACRSNCGLRLSYCIALIGFVFYYSAVTEDWLVMREHGQGKCELAEGFSIH